MRNHTILGLCWGPLTFGKLPYRLSYHFRGACSPNLHGQVLGLLKLKPKLMDPVGSLLHYTPTLVL